MDIRPMTGYNESEILPLYESVGWTAYTSSPDTLRKGFENSLLVLGAYQEDMLLGLIRAVGDSHTIVWIQDLLVFPQYQRQGIGTALIRDVLRRFDHVRQIQLATDDTPKTKSFYQSIGLYPMQEFGCCGFMKG